MSDSESPKPKKKSVGFAEAPIEDLQQHHKILRQKEEEKKKSSSFHKIPPELAYLEKKNLGQGPKQISPKPPSVPSFNRTKLSDLPDLKNLKYFDVKDISVQNKETELQFHYSQIDLPPAADSVIVDVKYGSLNSLDLAKINQYLLNLSNVKVGLGYEFSGVVNYVGANMSSKFSIGDFVVGAIDPSARRGALSTCQLVHPGRDVLIKVDEETLNQLNNIDIELKFNVNEQFEIDSDEESRELEQQLLQQQNKPKKGTFPVENTIPPLGKISTFPVLYNRAKQLLQYLSAGTNRANILINGADTTVGLTLIQVLLSEYQFSSMNLLCVIRESSSKYMEQAVNYFSKKYYDPSADKQLTLIPFDIVNDDLIFPGEKVPIVYKKPNYFAIEIIDALLNNDHGSIDTSNINDYKLDSIIDLIGCKKYFQETSIKLHEIETLNLPFKSKMNASLESLFGKEKEPFLVKILKPKKFGSSLVSGCNFNIEKPSYNINELSAVTTEILNPWSSKWSSNLFNNWTTYNYYDEIQLKIKQEWCNQGLELLLANQLKFKIDHYIDWRNDYKQYVNQLKLNDGKVVFKVEDF
ncbi:hypothetical protein JA1_003204 [Spathaspora sp. JA1]|nr:hypothetical protein JA1_003204 [Spathaspora sp. JA1]